MKRFIAFILLVLSLTLACVACVPQGSDAETTEKKETTEQISEYKTEEKTQEKTKESVEEPTEKQTENSTEKSTEKPTEVTTEKPTEEPTEVTTEKPAEETTEKLTEEPTEEPTEVTNEDLDRIIEILTLDVEEPACRVLTTELGLVMSGKINGLDFNATLTQVEVEAVRNVNDVKEYYSVTTTSQDMNFGDIASQSTTYTDIEGFVDGYRLYGYIPGEGAEGKATYLKAAASYGDEDGEGEDDNDLNADDFLTMFDTCSLDEVDGIYVIIFSDYNGTNAEMLNAAFNLDSFGGDGITDMGMTLHVDIESNLLISMQMTISLEMADFFAGMGLSVNGSTVSEVEVVCNAEYYGEEHSILPENYDDYITVDNIEYAELIIDEIEYYFNDVEGHESLSFDTVTEGTVYTVGADGESELMLAYAERDTVNLGYLNDKFVFSIDADIEYDNETADMQLIYKDGKLNIYSGGVLASSNENDDSQAAALIESSYYDKMIFNMYDVSDVKVVLNDDGTTTVIIDISTSERVDQAIAEAGLEGLEMTEASHICTAVLDEELFLVSLEVRTKITCKVEEGVECYVEVFSGISNIGEADMSLINVKVPSVAA